MIFEPLFEFFLNDEIEVVERTKLKLKTYANYDRKMLLDLENHEQQHQGGNNNRRIDETEPSKSENDYLISR